MFIANGKRFSKKMLPWKAYIFQIAFDKDFINFCLFKLIGKYILNLDLFFLNVHTLNLKNQCGK